MQLVSRRPALLRSARDLYHECGAYQLRAVLNAHGHDASPEELYRSALHRRFDWSLPWSMPAILAHYGIRARSSFWSRSAFKERKLALLAEDRPILFVANSIRGSGRLHWLSSWGHDPATDEFIVYDSQAPAAASAPGAEAPAGNARYATELLLSHLPWRGTFALTIVGS